MNKMPTSGAMAGMVVIELGQIYNGPYCGLLLGFLGARVIKVEPPGGDVLRARSRGDEDPMPYLMLNSNKESVVLDLKEPRGKELFLDLVDSADVLVENFSVGVMDRLGLGWATLHERNRRLVYATGTGFGLTGPYRHMPAMDLTVQAMSGAMSATGYPDSPPVRCGPAVADFLSGTHLTVGVLAALLARQQTGEGQLVEVSMHEATVMATISAVAAVMERGPDAVPERTGNRHPGLAIAPYNAYEAKDGYVVIFCVTERHWEGLLTAIDRGDLRGDPRYGSNVDRAERMGEVDDIVEGWVGSHTKAFVFSRLAAAHVPCAPVLTAAEVIEDPHLEERGAWQDMEDLDRKVRLPRAPLRLYGTPLRGIERVAPALGADTARVVAEVQERVQEKGRAQ